TAPANGKVSLGTFTPTTGAGVLNMTLDVSGSTQYGEKFALRNTQQDGYAAGKLNEVTVSESGVVYARYSNGDDKPLGQVALTTFNNTQGLESKGNNLGVETFESGTPRTGMPATSLLGKFQAGSLDVSSKELT
ncbi:flagellar hook-basal body complex protein, partial [Pseudomonas aeruginosa]|uniref:flagellar hook-basal body complex protein n=1 Tax=Pseudomonas aeruginosa TaxID=287 RepID=UPI0021178974